MEKRTGDAPVVLDVKCVSFGGEMISPTKLRRILDERIGHDELRKAISKYPCLTAS
jgi:hypothetical protein